MTFLRCDISLFKGVHTYSLNHCILCECSVFLYQVVSYQLEGSQGKSNWTKVQHEIFRNTPISNSSELEGWRPDQALASPHGLHTKWIQYWHHIPVQVLDFYISLSPPSSNIILTLTCSGSRFRQESMHLTQMCHKLTYEL